MLSQSKRKIQQHHRHLGHRPPIRKAVRLIFLQPVQQQLRQHLEHRFSYSAGQITHFIHFFLIEDPLSFTCVLGMLDGKSTWHCLHFRESSWTRFLNLHFTQSPCSENCCLKHLLQSLVYYSSIPFVLQLEHVSKLESNSLFLQISVSFFLISSAGLCFPGLTIGNGLSAYFFSQYQSMGAILSGSGLVVAFIFWLLSRLFLSCYCLNSTLLISLFCWVVHTSHIPVSTSKYQKQQHCMHLPRVFFFYCFGVSGGAYCFSGSFSSFSSFFLLFNLAFSNSSCLLLSSALFCFSIHRLHNPKSSKTSSLINKQSWQRALLRRPPSYRLATCSILSKHLQQMAESLKTILSRPHSRQVPLVIFLSTSLQQADWVREFCYASICQFFQRMSQWLSEKSNDISPFFLSTLSQTYVLTTPLRISYTRITTFTIILQIFIDTPSVSSEQVRIYSCYLPSRNYFSYYSYFHRPLRQRARKQSTTMKSRQGYSSNTFIRALRLFWFDYSSNFEQSGSHYFSSIPRKKLCQQKFLKSAGILSGKQHAKDTSPSSGKQTLTLAPVARASSQKASALKKQFPSPRTFLKELTCTSSFLSSFRIFSSLKDYILVVRFSAFEIEYVGYFICFIQRQREQISHFGIVSLERPDWLQSLLGDLVLFRI